MKRSLVLIAAVALLVSTAVAPAAAFASLTDDVPVQTGEQGTMEQGMEDSTATAAHVEEKDIERKGSAGYGLAALAAALAVGLCAVGTGYAQAKIGGAGGGALAERPELQGIMIILVAIPETAVILGFVIAIQLIGKL